MIQLATRTDFPTGVRFCTKERALELGTGDIFKGKYLEIFSRVSSLGEQEILIGLGEKKLTKREVMEAAACAAACMRDYKIWQYYVDTTGIESFLTESNWSYFIQGLYLGGYVEPSFTKDKIQPAEISILVSDSNLVEDKLREGLYLGEGVEFAREMVNYPGNLLRPRDFAQAIARQMKGLAVEVEILEEDQLKELAMNGLRSVGGSSAFPPCMVVLRYCGNQDAAGEVIGLVGKGVTCDTGGYCLKPAGSMGGIRGDMAGGAAVAGSIYALAKNHEAVNVIGVIPICENRISPDSYLPGDVITMYDKTTVEICNTDAEGRLILADGVAYALDREHVTQIVDIATLTGAVVNLFGFSIGGVLCDNEALYERFAEAAKVSTEQYARIPFYQEHEEMIESRVAELKNLGPNYCGTITAGLFIRHFAKGKPWLHLDIAGTAWVEEPLWKFQSKGATGAGVTTLYEMCKQQKTKGEN
ncbi:leucyl aminopeptidase [Lachnospiraceae bacterium PM6-15]|uniref:leucyl aminopeptidase family protein n=1 Tax=Ohessyouella blattaphilus TaxID=2949333 RepID=UPI003E2F5789